jgi:pyrroloquinoline quinone (PQQ) biosynthesis protein C
MDSFFQELEVDLRPGIVKILTHPFLQRLAEASLASSQLREFAVQYNAYCSYFPRYLAAVAANVPDDATRLSLVENLWEEHGEGNLALSHRTLFHRFLTALGITEKERQTAKPLPSTSEYVNTLFEICHSAHFLEGFGTLSLGTELFTSEEYAIILAGLKKYDFLSLYDLEFWSIHIDLDEDHYSDMASALAPWIHSDTNKKLIQQGAQRAVELEISFWDGLQKALSL